jgi:hypothetical protein
MKDEKIIIGIEEYERLLKIEKAFNESKSYLEISEFYSGHGGFPRLSLSAINSDIDLINRIMDEKNELVKEVNKLKGEIYKLENADILKKSKSFWR